MSDPLNDPPLYRSDDPLTRDPQFQRRVVAIHRPIPIVENIYEAKLECGHEPLLLGGIPPVVGSLYFCPSCYELAKNAPI